MQFGQDDICIFIHFEEKKQRKFVQFKYLSYLCSRK